MKKRTALIVCFLVLGAALMFAHAPILLCYDNGDGTITCEAGFSDGSSAKGNEIRVENPKEKDPKKKVLIKGKIDKNGEFTFKKPSIKEFIVIFDAGPGHIVKVKSTDIK